MNTHDNDNTRDHLDRDTLLTRIIDAEASAEDWAAFRAFAGLYPGPTVLVDTYDTLRGVRRVIDLVQTESLQIGARRLDSGDLSALAKGARGLLDDAGLVGAALLAEASLTAAPGGTS